MNSSNWCIFSLISTLENGQIAFISFFIILFSLALIFIISYLIYCELKRRKGDGNHFYNVRIYTYNYARKTFYCFDKSNLINTKTFTESEFLEQFKPSDTYRITEWLNHLVTEKNASKTILVDVKLSGKKAVYSTILNVTSLNLKKHLIHFESQLLPYLNNAKPVKVKNGVIISNNLLQNEEECKEFTSKADAEILGAIIYISLQADKNPTLDDEEILNRQKTFSFGLKKIVIQYTKANRKLYLLNETTLILIDNSCMSKLMAMNIASSIYTSIQQYVNFNSSELNYSIAIGVTIGTLYQGNYTLGREQAKKMVDAIFQGKSKVERVLLYDENFFTSYETAKMQKEEVKVLIKNSTFRIYYTATIDIASHKQSFYLLKFSPYGTSLTTFNDVLSNASSLKNGQEQLFNKIHATVKRNVLASHKPCEIAIELPYQAVKRFEKALEEQDEMITWIVCFRASELLALQEDSNTIQKNFRSYRDRGLKVAIIIDTLASSLRQRVLRQVNYFFIPNLFTANARDMTEAKKDLRTIKTMYLMYKIPICCYGLSQKDDIENAVNNGGTIIQCDEISKPSSRFEVIEEEKLDAIIEEAKKVAPHHLITSGLEVLKEDNNG